MALGLSVRQELSSDRRHRAYFSRLAGRSATADALAGLRGGGSFGFCPLAVSTTEAAVRPSSASF